MPRLFPIRALRSNEEVFFDHYSLLLQWALQLSHADRDNAEDLIQDFYLQIAHMNVALAEIREIEPYLFKVLRNLHYSRLRRQGQGLRYEHSIEDFESLERGLAAVDRNELILVRADLQHICESACARKSASRAACIFILRFFLGYYPSEVMKIARMSRMAVDRALQVARQEVRTSQQRPDEHSSADHNERLRARSGGSAGNSAALFLEIRQTILNSCEGPCFPLPVLERHYSAESAARFSTPELAHLVSCKKCLDLGNVLLGLPLLDERSPDDTIGRDNPPGAGSGDAPKLTVTRGKRQDVRERRRMALERHMREFHEHRPESLELAINGETRTTHKVTAEVSELKLTLNRAEEPSFIEVFSERGVRLAYLHVAEPASSPDLEQQQHLELSDNRSLTLTLSFAGNLPTVCVMYKDPVFCQDAAMEEELKFFPLIERNRIERQGIEIQQEETNNGAPPAAALSPLRRLLSALTGISGQFTRPRMNPLLASAVLLGFCSVLCFFLWTRSAPKISAESLLSRAEQAEISAGGPDRPGVIYQKVRIRAAGRSMERAIYRDPQRKRRLKRTELNAGDEWIKDKLTEAGVNWDEPLSAENYADWRDRLQAKKDTVARAGENLLKLTTSTEAGGLVSEESLTVRESDFHPVERTIELRDAGEVEIAELNYDVMSWAAVNQDSFEPAAGAVMSAAPSILAAIHLPHALSDLELDEAELAARTVLSQLRADTGEPIHLVRRADGIDIKGVVETNARKQELIVRLTMLPNVRASILSGDEIGTRLLSRAALSGEQPVHVYSVESQPSPIEQYLNAKNMPADQLASISHNLLDGSLKVSRAEVHLTELQPRFAEANRLPMEQRTQLASLARNYAGTILAGVDANEQILRSLGFLAANQTANQAAAVEPGEAGQEIHEQIRQYRQLCMDLISNGTGQSRPAPEIAEELIRSGERIRARIASLSPTVPRDQN